MKDMNIFDKEQPTPPRNPEIFRDFILRRNDKPNMIMGEELFAEKEEIKKIIVDYPEYVGMYSNYPIEFCKEFIKVNPEVIFYFKERTYKRCEFAMEQFKSQQTTVEIKNRFIGLVKALRLEKEFCSNFGKKWWKALLDDDKDIYFYTGEIKIANNTDNYLANHSIKGIHYNTHTDRTYLKEEDNNGSNL